MSPVSYCSFSRGISSGRSNTPCTGQPQQHVKKQIHRPSTKGSGMEWTPAQRTIARSIPVSVPVLEYCTLFLSFFCSLALIVASAPAFPRVSGKTGNLHVQADHSAPMLRQPIWLNHHHSQTRHSFSPSSHTTGTVDYPKNPLDPLSLIGLGSPPDQRQNTSRRNTGGVVQTEYPLGRLSSWTCKYGNLSLAGHHAWSRYSETTVVSIVSTQIVSYYGGICLSSWGSKGSHSITHHMNAFLLEPTLGHSTPNNFFFCLDSFIDM
ncbi:hypothetical protein HOY80DRAFT_980634 [Tuber brumale]|nr:hypothetical protein HOY80DRAFT_980634 [Tuber brumale]